MTDPARMTYGGYLDLEHLLDAQHPISDHHDELLNRCWKDGHGV